MGPVEFIIILFVILLLFGYKALPKLGSGIGKSVAAFKKGRDEKFDEVPDPDEEPVKKAKKSKPKALEAKTGKKNSKAA